MSAPARKRYRKRRFPVDNVRRFLEPGPVVLLATAWKGQANVMTLGWHMVMGFDPSLIACYIWDANHSFELARRSRQCVINLPTSELLDAVIGIGNCSGTQVDKFEKFGLAIARGHRLDAPVIEQCYASFECRLYDASQISRHGLFIWQVVYAQVATSPKYPETVHYRGDGVFMISGRNVSRRSGFLREKL